jgi:hypothetical protein
VGDSLLDAAREALDQAGLAAFVADRDGVVVGVTGDLLLIFGAGVERATVPLGSHSFSREWVSFQERTPGGTTLASQREMFRALAPAVAADLGGVERLRAVVDPRLHDLLEDVEPTAAREFWSGRVEVNFGDRTTPIDLFTFRLRQDTGQPVGWVTITKPGISAVVLAMLATGDAQLMERMLRILQPARRPAALLFADLESSSKLSRQLSSRDYFALIRRLTVRADRSVVRAGGIVGKHVGDGITAFFLARRPDRSRAQRARASRQRARCAGMRSIRPHEASCHRRTCHCGSVSTGARPRTSGGY